ncbi:UbiA family prenyltransferase [Roseibacterium beibuensis]|uniref:UbiA family prenyltransferase n=1 Tax=[Roseibacterium] beibuensis TaxID=1193142 RepID=UPI00217EFDB0|nr:UbiA family prenyltransferase [Roseibacterium beibuensis]MCS6624440.1 UbiA family prenyltransferase [Roseibacterium beibuensis]
MTSAPLPDAGSNWVDRHAPEGLKPWLKLGRFDRPIGIWLLLLPGWQGVALALSQYRKTPDLYDAWLFLGFALGACLMRAAGCAFNDIVDRDIDAQVARTAMRPIPSGRISVRQAWAFVVGCSLTSLLILLTLNATAIALGVASLALVAAYPFMKRITWWPQAWLGLTFNWGALMGFAAAAPAALAVATAPGGRLALPEGLVLSHDVYLVEPGGYVLWLSAILLYLALVFWTLGYDTIYALQDIEDDAMVGVKSSARRLGPNVRRGVGLFYGLTVLLTVAAGAAAGLGPLFYVALLPWAAHLFRQARDVRADDPALALRLFKSNRDAGLILLVAIILGSVQFPL